MKQKKISIALIDELADVQRLLREIRQDSPNWNSNYLCYNAMVAHERLLLEVLVEEDDN